MMFLFIFSMYVNDSSEYIRQKVILTVFIEKLKKNTYYFKYKDKILLNLINKFIFLTYEARTNDPNIPDDDPMNGWFGEETPGEILAHELGHALGLLLVQKK